MIKSYLGDGVYASIDDFGAVTLVTEYGISATDTIVLELEAYDALDLLVMKWRQAR